jgi:hypothetical protein
MQKNRQMLCEIKKKKPNDKNTKIFKISEIRIAGLVFIEP